MKKIKKGAICDFFIIHSVANITKIAQIGEKSSGNIKSSFDIKSHSSEKMKRGTI